MGNLYANYGFSMSRCQTICAGKKDRGNASFCFVKSPLIMMQQQQRCFCLALIIFALILHASFGDESEAV